MLNVYADGEYSKHLSELAGFEESLNNAREECGKLKEKYKEAKKKRAGSEKKAIKSDMEALSNSMKIYRTKIKEISKHIMLLHPKEYRSDFSTRYKRNKRKQKIDLDNTTCRP
ncbi:MAG: hypothetical protein JXA66_05375 [Oligoflexia bacterium]|nr:hypothetical protein [Oligoflexia bacterium]